jgi:histidine triad (HIT) family protein
VNDLDDCLFCRIVRKEVATDIVEESTDALAFKDINPQAPVHIVIVPKEHITSLAHMRPEILVDMFKLINDITISEGIAQSGYRLVLNVGEDAGQEQEHLHIHLLGGRFMGWPPG